MIAIGGANIGSLLMTLLIAMTPVLELRAAIPAGVIAGLDLRLVVIIAIIGNLIPIPFIIVFIRRIFKWMQTRSERLAKLARRMEEKADRKKDKVLKYEFWGLMLFVAIPLPGTGAWTGALIAAMLDMQLKRAFPSIAAGVAIAAIIVTVATYGLASLV